MLEKPTSNMAESHPSHASLTAFGLGECDSSESTAIEIHLRECDACCEVLSNLPEDGLIARLGKHVMVGETNKIVARQRETEVGPTRTVGFSEVADSLRNHPKYELVRKLGEGGMGVVYLVRHRLMNRLVALKVIAPKLIQDADARRRFLREVQIAAKLNHANIVSAFDADEIAGNPCLVSEYFDAESVENWVGRGRLSIENACDIACQVAEGIGHAHEHDLIHRDIKPQNILVAQDGTVKVVDFGLARYATTTNAENQSVTSEGLIVGTPDFMSPEQIREQAVDHRSDIYSLGCTLYYLLVGSAPYADSARMEKLGDHLNSTPVSLKTIRPDVPPQLEAAVSKMMNKTPAERYQTAAEVCSELQRISPKEITQETIPPAAIDQVVHGGRLRPRATVPRLLLGLTLLIVTGLFASQLWWGSPAADRIEVLTPELKERSWKLLVVMPEDPVMRDYDLLYRALDDLELTYEVSSTSSASQLEYVPHVIPLQSVTPSQFDAVIFLGPEKYEQTGLTTLPGRSDVERIVNDIRSRNQPIASFGTGVWTLANLDLLKGKSVADCKHTNREDRRRSGAVWQPDETLVVDDYLITGTDAIDAKSFVTTLLLVIANPQP